MQISKQLPPFRYNFILEQVSVPFSFTKAQFDFNIDYVPDNTTQVNSDKYAVMFLGNDGGSGHMWSALSHMYCGLLDHGFPAENIFVLSYDGTVSPETNQSLNLDNDPDEIPDILPVPCNSEQLGLIFQQLENELDEGDILYIFATAHGVQDEPYPTPSESNLVLWEDELLDDDVFASMLEGINCSQMIFNIFACYAGGFTDELENMNNSARKTILTCTSWEHPYVRDGGFMNEALMDIYNYLICSALRGGHPDIENNAPWNSPYAIGESPFFTTIFPNSGGEINFDLPENGGNNNGIQEINETVLYGEDNDFQFFTYGDKIYDCGFIEDLLSLEGITGKVENTQTVDGSFYIGGHLSVESNVDLTLSDNTKFFLHNSEVTVKTSAILILGDNVTFVAKEGDCKLIVDGDISIGSNASFIAEDEAQLEIILNNHSIQASFNSATFENTSLDSYAQNLTITNSTFNSFYRVLSHRGIVNISYSVFTSNSGQSWLFLENTEDNQNTATVSGCTFTTDISMSAIDMWNYNLYSISDNTIDGYYNGIQIMQSGYGDSKKNTIKENTITNCKLRGIIAYGTRGSVYLNHISNNTYGVWFGDHSSMRLYGNSGAANPVQTQEIMDNESYEVYASQYSFPIYFRYNVIIDDDNGGAPSDPLVYHSDGNMSLKDVRYNCWEDEPGAFVATEDLYSGGYIWEPEWCPGSDDNSTPDPDEDMYEIANNLFDIEDYAGAKDMYEMLIDQYPESKLAKAAMQELFALEKFVSNNYSDLKQYYANNTDPELSETRDYMASKCDIKLENWPDAINYYENIIIDPETLEDSIFAIIDLGYVYFVMENNGYKSAYTGNLVQYKPESKKQFFDYSDYLLSLIPGDQLSKTMKGNIASLKEGELLQNVPNPFKGSTQIWYKTNTESNVHINIYNYTGQLIYSINEGTKTNGIHHFDFNANGLKNGIYFYTISINGQTTDSKKMTIIK
jgi:parallel beta-helix repeat protein